MLAPRFDPADPEVLEDPYSVYARLREVPLARGGPGQWVVTRHADVSALLHDPRLGVEVDAAVQDATVGTGPASLFRQRIVLNRDPPGHTRLRASMQEVFGPQAIRRRAEDLNAQLTAALHPVLAVETLDAITDLAQPACVRVLCQLVGFPEADRAFLEPVMLALRKLFVPFVAVEDRAEGDDAVVTLRAYVTDLVASKSFESDSLVGAMLRHVGADDLDLEEVVDNLFFVMFSGFETTINTVVAVVDNLARHPDQFRELQRTRGVAGAVEEALRFDAAIQATGRIVNETIELAGKSLRPGRALLLLLGSANHDEREFAAPERFDVTRSPNPHLTFGGGIHHCVGAWLTRTLCASVVDWLLDNVAGLEPAGPAQRESLPIFRGYTSAPIALQPASR